MSIDTAGTSPGLAGGQSEGAIEVRTIREDELSAWARALNLGFMRAHVGEDTELLRTFFEADRWLAGFGNGHIVSTFRSFDAQLTVPGGAAIAADAITNVAVKATHRRRRLLSRMMAEDLSAARGRGSAVAILIAAEYNIYGRFGFGPATLGNGCKVDLARAGGLRTGLPEPVGGRIDFATMTEVRELGPLLHERYRRIQPGAIDRSPSWWQLNTGAVTPAASDWTEPLVAVHRDASGTVTGLIAYRVDGAWDGALPDCTLTVSDFLALDLPTAVALWQFAFSVDRVHKVVVSGLAPDDPLPLLLNDPRAVTPQAYNADFMWLRVLDVPAAFNARSYDAPGRVVLDVTDPAGYAAGRWALEAATDGTGRCTATTDDPDLSLGASALGTLYLSGHTSASCLTAARLITENRPGAAAAADRILRTHSRAWNPDEF
ncbi:GNAT family N-acetyltransferase [Streptomyces vinaceus]|uniref:GNAT family N-acetyltransferase n=1 Tax=Streptomyces vinaceus TaxID=1960 RepID=UPI00368F5476